MAIFLSPDIIEDALRENAAKHRDALDRRPEPTPARGQVAEGLSGLATRLLEQAKQLRDAGDLGVYRLKDPEGKPSHIGLDGIYTEDEDKQEFTIDDNQPGAMTEHQTITYWPKDKRGRVNTSVRLPAGYAHNVLEVNFWTGENATSNGSFQDTNSQGPHQEDLMTDEELTAIVPKVTGQFDKAITRFAEVKSSDSVVKIK